jgi:hypothetical protein
VLLLTKVIQFLSEDNKMKKILSTLVAAIIAISFAGIAFAQEAPAPAPAATTATPAAGEVKKDVKKHHKKHCRKHHRKHHRKHMKEINKETVPAAPAEAPTAK